MKTNPSYNVNADPSYKDIEKFAANPSSADKPTSDTVSRIGQSIVEKQLSKIPKGTINKKCPVDDNCSGHGKCTKKGKNGGF